MWGGTAIGCGELPPGREMPVYMVERLREGRLYLEPVEVSGADIDSADNDLYR